MFKSKKKCPKCGGKNIVVGGNTATCGNCMHTRKV
jgi:ribosomal protein S27AE